ncbi:hypothetical protein Hokovirus_3_223 [Hokovirus HKV1]|uniref:Uncharacterized protein n=1 Tax=Hokovirus HKV1 TaxID=1977638 RepID=A0A1V0SGV5_9VIRU|nr:hypothetical protein Hokovirus_3_223 [Hokovirus HKV1]
MSEILPMIYRLILKEKYKNIKNDKFIIYDDINLDKNILSKYNILTSNIISNCDLLILNYDDNINKILENNKITTILTITKKINLDNLPVIAYSYHKTENNLYLVLRYKLL